MNNSLNEKNQSTGIGIMICLALVPLLMVLGNAVLIPVLPDIQTNLHITKVQSSLLITLFSVPAGIAIPFFGVASDSIPRKWIIIVSLIVFGIGGVGAGIAAMWVKHPYGWILGSRIIQGIGAAGTAPIAMAVVADLYSGASRSRALGVNEAGNALGKVISPILGSLVALITWGTVFFIFPILCVPLAIALWFIVPKMKKEKSFDSIHSYMHTAKNIFADKGKSLAKYYLFGGIALFSLFGALVYLSDLLESQLRVSGIYRGFIIAIPLLTLTISALITGIVTHSEKGRMSWFILGGFVIIAGSFVISPLFGTRIWILVGFICLGALGTGCVLPCLNTFITSTVDSTNRGLVTSFYGTVRFLGVAAGPPIFTWLAGISPKLMFWVIAALTGICAVIAITTVRKPIHPQGERTEKPFPMSRKSLT